MTEIHYHKRHEPYISAVADALAAAGFPVADWYADANDPRDGAIQLDLERQGTIDGKPIWSHDEVWIGWQEERRWTLLTVDERPFDDDSRFVYDLDLATVASPASVVLEVAGKAGLTLEVAADGYRDVDFPDHVQDDEENPELEAALLQYFERADA